MTDHLKSEQSASAYYFGTFGQPGHYLFDEQMEKIYATGYGESFRYDCPLPWENDGRGHYIDGTLNPSEREGEAAHHHKDGWTALAFANRTDDRRPGSNSVFFFRGTLTFDEALKAAWADFPQVMERLSFTIFDTAGC